MPLEDSPVQCAARWPLLLLEFDVENTPIRKTYDREE
jgi:hypothetical protein